MGDGARRGLTPRRRFRFLLPMLPGVVGGLLRAGTGFFTVRARRAAPPSG